MTQFRSVFAVVVVLLSVIWAQTAQAQATAAVANSITCSASGSSVQVLAAAASRESYLVSNTSGVTVRLGFLSGSSTANLTDSNSIQLLAGQIFTDSAPSIFIGRVVCMSSDATPRVVYVIETRRP